MLNPYLVLGLDLRATDAQARSRYLELIREHPPEKAGGRFAEILAAYTALKTPHARGEWLALNVDAPGPSAEAVAADWARLSPPPAPLPLKDFQDLLRNAMQNP